MDLLKVYYYLSYLFVIVQLVVQYLNRKEMEQTQRKVMIPFFVVTLLVSKTLTVNKVNYN